MLSLQGAQGCPLTLWGVGWGGRWEGDSRGKGYMYIYDQFMLIYGRNQNSIVKQLSLKNKKIKKQKNPLQSLLKHRILSPRITDSISLILECEVKWALGSSAVNKASGGDGIPAELFKILKDDAIKGLHSICEQIWKTQKWPQDWKRSILIQIPKKSSTKECSNPDNCTHLPC